MAPGWSSSNRCAYTPDVTFALACPMNFESLNGAIPAAMHKLA